MSEFIRLQANGADAYPDASTENTYRPNGTSVESALVNLESNVTTLGGVAGEAKTLAEQNSVKIATAEQEMSNINSSLEDIGAIKNISVHNLVLRSTTEGDTYIIQESGYYSIELILDPNKSYAYGSFMINGYNFFSHASSTGTQRTTLEIPVHFSKNPVIEIGNLSDCTCNIFKLF